MEPQNITGIPEFLLLGLSEDPELQTPLFAMFFFIYLITLLGNLLIILAVSTDTNLHSPMYFFLSCLSLADIGFTSTTVPRMLKDISTPHKIISYVDCLTQLSLILFFGCMDSLLLTAMAYDRFVAICHPLHYPVIMKPQFCSRLVLISFSISILDSQLHCLMVSQLTFCTEVEIPTFFCDPPQLLNLACSVTSTNGILEYCMIAIFAGPPVSVILLSYQQILSVVLRVPSSGGKYKAFSTCGSHLIVVGLYYGTAIGVYLSLILSPSFRSGAVASVVYNIVTPMLNPFIYSLRNQDVKRALRRLFSRIMSF
ncbi:olfactory receptor 7E24-like [Rhynchocyon petersi]